jgi:hypothetical protein
MKTYNMKTTLVMALLTATMTLQAQNKEPKKTCIVIHSNVNGKELDIDTCFTNMSDADIQKQLTAMGVNDMPDTNGTLDSMKIVINDDEEKGDSVKAEVIMINDDKEDGDDKGGKTKTVKVIGGKNGNASAYVMGDDGKDEEVTVSEGGNGKAKVIVRHGGKDMVIEDDDMGKNGKVYVYKKVIIKDVSDDDAKKLPDGVAISGKPFAGLKMSPNPTEGTISIAYTSNSSEPLQIDVYDMNGKKIHSETLNKMSGEVIVVK